MKGRILVLTLLLALVFCGAAHSFEGFKVYTDRWATDNHFIPSGWMGDHGDIKFNDSWTDSPHSGKTCIKITYSGKVTQGAGWIGIYWQNPANNWGSRDGGFDITGAQNLTFWGRGENGGEVVTEFKMGGIAGEYGDSDSIGIGPVVFTDDWKKYTISLDGLDLSYISGGFCFSASKMDNPEGFSIYLDDIKYE